MIFMWVLAVVLLGLTIFFFYKRENKVFLTLGIVSVILLWFLILILIVVRTPTPAHTPPACIAVGGSCAESCVELEGTWVRDSGHACGSERLVCCIQLGTEIRNP